MKERYGGRLDPPKLIPELKQPGALDLQDELFALWERPEKAMWKADAEASDGKAVWMPGDHNFWSIYLPVSDSVFRPLLGKRCTAYVVVRVEKGGDAGVAFMAGVYDKDAKKSACELSVSCKEISAASYRVYKLGSFTPSRGQYFWAAPAKNGENVKSVWVDRFVIVPE